MATKRRPLLLGKRHEAPLRRVLARVDPFKHYQVDEEKGSWVHDAFTVFFLGLMLAYTIMAFSSYVNRDEVEVFSFVPMSTLQPLTVSLSLTCDQALCIDATVSWDYSTTSSACVTALEEQHGMLARSTTFAGGVGDVEVPVCPVEQTGGDGVVVDWVLHAAPPAERGVRDHHDVLDGKAEVTLRTGDLVSVTQLQQWHDKNVVLGSVAKKKGDEFTARSAYVSAVQYVGSLPNDAAHLGIILDQFAQLYEVKRPGSLLEVLASIGGAASLILPFMRITTWAIAKWDHNSREKRRQRKGADTGEAAPADVENGADATAPKELATL